MTISLPGDVEQAVRPVFEALPLERAMPTLTGEGDPGPELMTLVKQAVAQPAVADRPALAAGLWLYIDQLHTSHTISQGIDNPTGSYWHGIMHRREPDFPNSHFWFRKTGHHPAIALVGADYDPHQMIDDVEAATQRGEQPDELLQLQRREWATLFEWCCGN